MPLSLRLFHGRADPSDVLDEWGSDGPTIGPFDTFHVAYLGSLRLLRDDEELTLAVCDDLISFDGIFYADYEITTDVPANALGLEAAERRSTSRPRPSLLERCSPLTRVFLDAVRSEHGAELARRLETLLRTSVTRPPTRSHVTDTPRPDPG